VNIGVAKISEKNAYGKTARLYPAEARMGGTTYSAPLQGRLILKVDNQVILEQEKILSQVPIMVKVGKPSFIPKKGGGA